MEISNLRCVRADNPSPMTLDGTRTYIAGESRPLVIDPGPLDPWHLERVARAVGAGGAEAILLTHAHPDHAAGAEWLAQRLSVSIHASAGTLRQLELTSASGVPLEDGEVVTAGRTTLRALAMPGHTPCHLAFLWAGKGAPSGDAVFVGDLLMGEGDTTLVAPPEGDLRAYLESLERIGRLEAAILFPAHGPPLRDPAATVRRFISHRMQRIAQVRNLLRESGFFSASEVAAAVYGPNLDPGLARAAEGSVAAVMLYLVWQRKNEDQGLQNA